MPPRLMITNGPSQGVSMLLPLQGAIVLGRHPKCHIQFSDTRISIYHCRIFRMDQKDYCIEDLRSTNGTLVNHEKISGYHLLISGDEVQIGDTTLKFVEESGTSESAPPESLEHTQSIEVLNSTDSLSTPKVQVGEYEIIKKIGDGAMGQVFKGRNVGTGQVAAIKMLHSYLMDEISMQRFLQEVQICMKFEHPRIVKVYDFAMYHNRPVIVMEYVDGQTLRERIVNKGTLSLKLSLHIGAQIAQGLHYAHKHNVVHRDLNPSNVLLDSRYQAKIIDFGLVKVYGKNITMNSETLGTLHYCPPEQIENASTVDHRADIYALGATIYHCLLGKPPFFDIQGVNALTLHIPENKAEPLHQLMDVPDSVSNIIQKAMHPKREKRYQTAQEFCKELVTELERIIATK